jgi:hypothetical protein
LVRYAHVGRVAIKLDLWVPLNIGQRPKAVALLRITHLGHARAAHRAETRVHDAVVVRLDDDVRVLAALADDVVHRRRVPGVGLGRLLLAQVDPELVLVRGGAALLVGRPSVGLVAASNDAVVAGDVVFLGVLE